MTADSLRDRIAAAVEAVCHEPGSGTPCDLCLETADAVLAVLADADPTDLWGLVWRRLGTAHPRTEETR